MNIGIKERIIRGIIGLVFLYAGYSVGGAIEIIAYIIGIVFILTGVIGICPIYKFLGINNINNSVIKKTQENQENKNLQPEEQKVQPQPQQIPEKKNEKFQQADEPSSATEQTPQWPTS